MNYLVTGGAGFIGSHLVEALVKKQDRGFIRVIDNLSTGKSINVEPFLKDIEFLKGDLNDHKLREMAVKDIDIIFHHAAIPSVPRSVEDPYSTHQNGVNATFHLLDSARQANVKRLIFAGSSSAYGDIDPNSPKIETLPLNPLSPYAASKTACEQYLQAFSKCYELDTVTLRYFNIFGPRQDPGSPYSGVISLFCKAFCNDSPITIYGDGEQTRDFTYIENVVNANFAAANSTDNLNGRVINIGCGQKTSLNQIISYLNEMTKKELCPTFTSPRQGDIKNSLADITRAEKYLGYKPKVLFKEGLKETFEWYHKNSKIS